MKVHIIKDFFRPEEGTSYEVDALVPFLMSKWSRLPDRTVIYHGRMDAAHNVTPKCEEDIDKLSSLPGPFFVVHEAGTGYEWVVYAILFAVAYVAAKSIPNIPIIAGRNTQLESPNNELSDRENRSRLKGRIPDIFGTVVSTPDLISVPYFRYVDNVKVEHAYMCVGRGEYEFLNVGTSGAYDIRDGDTLISEIPGTGLEVYAPNVSPNNGDPVFVLGDAILEPMFAAKRIDAVNGQTLLAPNDSDIVLDGDAGFLDNETFVGDGTDDFTSVGITTTAYIQSSKYYIPNAFNPGVFPIGDAPNGMYMTDNGMTLQYIAGSPNTVDLVFTSPSSLMLAGMFTPGYAIHIYYGVFSGVDVSGWYMVHAYDETTLTITLRSPEVIVPGITAITSATAPDVPGGPGGQWFTMYYFDNPGVDFSGNYPVSSVTSTVLTLTSPESVNPLAWYWKDALESNLANTAAVYYNSVSNVILGSATITDYWIGPFTINLKLMENFIINIVATQGMYKDNGTVQTSTSVDVQVEATPVNSAGVPTGPAQNFVGTVVGSSTDKSERAVTIDSSVALDVASRYKIRVRRVTPKDLSYTGQIVDEVKWADLYGMEYVGVSHFGNVTTIRSKTTATTGALNIKSRKLSCRVTRRVKLIQDDFTLGSTLQPSERMCDVLAHVCMDPYIGNRSVDNLDLQNFLETGQDITDYFGTDVAQQFCHTFDKTNLSFEETVQAIMTAAFSVAYRDGSLIKTKFEKLTSSSEILFNHRNKIPKSETRTYQFGVDGDVDGVEMEYSSPEDGSVQTYYIPDDRSALNPKKFTYAGVADPLHAYFHAWREWNKIRYRRVLTEFSATQEAEQLLVNSRVLVADNTRTGVQDGEIRSKDGLTIETSQPVKFVGGPYTIFIQNTDGTVQSMSCAPGVDEYHVLLASEPSTALSLDPENFALATYLIVKGTDVWHRAFLVQERETDTTMVSKLTAVNYDDRYYDNDNDFIDGVVDAEGNLI